jgi:hypothetical protein
MVFILAIQNGLSGLSFLTLVLFALAAGLLAGGLGIMIITYGALAWVPLLLMGLYMFITARGLYDLKKYGLYMAMVASVFWVLISIVILMFTSSFSDIQSMPLIQIPIPEDVPPPIPQIAAQLPDLLRTGMFLLTSIGRGYFLASLVYNVVVIFYLYSVRSFFQERIVPSATIVAAPSSPQPPTPPQ